MARMLRLVGLAGMVGCAVLVFWTVASVPTCYPQGQVDCAEGNLGAFWVLALAMPLWLAAATAFIVGAGRTAGRPALGWRVLLVALLVPFALAATALGAVGLSVASTGLDGLSLTFSAVLLGLAGANVALAVRAVALLRRPTAAPPPTPARSAPARR